jgi:hypothetical protein
MTMVADTSPPVSEYRLQAEVGASFSERFGHIKEHNRRSALILRNLFGAGIGNRS